MFYLFLIPPHAWSEGYSVWLFETAQTCSLSEMSEWPTGRRWLGAAFVRVERSAKGFGLNLQYKSLAREKDRICQGLPASIAGISLNQSAKRNTVFHSFCYEQRTGGNASYIIPMHETFYLKFPLAESCGSVEAKRPFLIYKSCFTTGEGAQCHFFPIHLFLVHKISEIEICRDYFLNQLGLQDVFFLYTGNTGWVQAINRIERLDGKILPVEIYHDQWESRQAIIYQFYYQDALMARHLVAELAMENLPGDIRKTLYFNFMIPGGRQLWYSRLPRMLPLEEYKENLRIRQEKLQCMIDSSISVVDNTAYGAFAVKDGGAGSEHCTSPVMHRDVFVRPPEKATLASIQEVEGSDYVTLDPGWKERERSMQAEMPLQQVDSK